MSKPSSTTFEYPPELLNKLGASISEPRLSCYLVKAKGDRKTAVEYYLWNTAISEALYCPLQGLEVTLRNALDAQLVTKHGDNWHTLAALFLDVQRDKITKTIADFDKDRPISRNDVVSRLSFGFWADILYHQMYEDLWRGALHKAFPFKEAGTMRKHIGPLVDGLRRLRNRVAHHEPIFSRALQQDYKNILKVVGFICPDTRDWIHHHSSFDTVFAERPFK